jgi:uncharacterized membrane protein HdeD (DUF308 family)
MLVTLARNWWAVALRGALAIIFGVLAFFWPGASLAALVLLFGAYALVDGIFAVIAAFRTADRGGRWGMLAIEGVAGIAAGILAFVWPGITAIVLLYLIAAWAIVTGVLEIAAAIQLRREITNEWLLGLGGLASIVFGVLLLFNPAAGALAVVWLIAAYALVFGVLLVALAFRLRSWYQHHQEQLQSGTDDAGTTGAAWDTRSQPAA